VTKPVARTGGQVKCSVCGADVWRARFGSDWRLVELAGKTVVPGSAGYVRDAGHVSLTFPLALPGSDTPILGAVVRKRTTYRIHQHTAFSAAALTGKRAAR